MTSTKGVLAMSAPDFDSEPAAWLPVSIVIGNGSPQEIGQIGVYGAVITEADGRGSVTFHIPEGGVAEFFAAAAEALRPKSRPKPYRRKDER